MKVHSNSNADFQVDHYRTLLRLAKKKFHLVQYNEIDKSKNFLLWRHDVDFSLNRALAIAKVEAEEGVKSTFFINPHAEFYNPLEKGQSELVKNIIELGHSIGLHFDCIYFGIKSEDQLETLISKEKDLLEFYFNTRINVFSFHNPTENVLTFENETYAGLINCYSRWFKESVSYCSDSNGYWRHKRLYDLLNEVSDEKLQVLTHPDWWTDQILYPRERIFRSIYGRARHNLEFYDRAVDSFGRQNLKGESAKLEVLKSASPDDYYICDLLWNLQAFDLLFFKLLDHLESRWNEHSEDHSYQSWKLIKENILKKTPEELRLICLDLIEKISSIKK